MKPLQIGLLVLVGAMGGALIMKLTQRPKPAPVPIAAAAPAPAPPAMAPAPSPPPDVEEQSKPAPAVAPKPVKRPPAVPMTHHTQPMQRPHPAETTVAHNLPPAALEPPAPAPVQETPAAPLPSEAAPAPAPEPAREPAEEPAPPPAPQAAPSVTLPTGLTFSVRLGQNLSSEDNQAGDTFTATLDAPISADGFVIAERGARVEGRLIEAQKARIRGQARLAVELTKLHTSDGQRIEIKTDIIRKLPDQMNTTDQVGVVAAAAGIGAVIGAMAGGGKGAVIGAGAGGVAGGGGVAAMRNKAVKLSTESKLSFRLTAPVTVTEQLNR